MKTYCTKCGFKIDYRANQKPNFCPKCGNSMGSLTGYTSEEQVEAAEVEEVSENLNISEDFELEYDIMEKPQSKKKLSDIMGTSQTPPEKQKKSKGKGRPKKVNKKEVWEQFKQEAGGQPHRREGEAD